MKRMMRPSAALTSRITALRRSSNSPWNFAPASIWPTSSATMRTSFICSGQSPFTMRCASPSTTAVLPTPGSPISTGLFLVRRLSTCMQRRISSSRPMTGSSLPPSAFSVRSMPYFFRASMVFSALGSFTFFTPLAARISSIAFRTLRSSAPSVASTCLAGVALDASASSRCSTLVYPSFIDCAARSASPSTCIRGCAGRGCAPLTVGMRRSSASVTSRTRRGSMPARSSTPPAGPRASAVSADNRCSGEYSACPAEFAAD